MKLNEYAKLCHKANVKWWQNPETGEPIKRNRGELIALIHSELSEALEGERKNLMDDKLTHHKMACVEMVDAVIRIFDYMAGIYPEVDIDQIFLEKMEYNANRQDHKHEARLAVGGKQF